MGACGTTGAWVSVTSGIRNSNAGGRSGSDGGAGTGRGVGTGGGAGAGAGARTGTRAGGAASDPRAGRRLTGGSGSPEAIDSLLTDAVDVSGMLADSTSVVDGAAVRDVVNPGCWTEDGAAASEAACASPSPVSQPTTEPPANPARASPVRAAPVRLSGRSDRMESVGTRPPRDDSFCAKGASSTFASPRPLISCGEDAKMLPRHPQLLSGLTIGSQ